MNSRLLVFPLLASLALLSACGGGGEVCKEAFITTHPDADGDGYGDSSAPENTCGLTEGRVENSGDCDDTNPESHNDAVEICDQLDNNCDGQTDEGLPFEVWFPDADGDGHGAGEGSVQSCLPPDGSVAIDDDCDDTNAAIHPDANEVCDGTDNDCDTLVDDDDDDVDVTTMETFFYDQDGDTYGDFLSTMDACVMPAAGSVNGEDCDDNNRDVNPGAAEVCNNIDDNCDTLIDEDDPTIDPALLTQFFTDADGDGYGDVLFPTEACDAAPGVVDNYDDCDDNDFLLGPPADWYVDADLDGFGFGNPVEYQTCIPLDPTLVPDGQGLDCDDNNAAINPLEYEICGDGIDSNCDTFDCTAYIEDFEAGALAAYWTQGGDADWTMLANNPYEGAFGAKCGNINDNQTSSMTMTVEMLDAGTFSFWHRGDTEAGWDFLQVDVDGALLFQQAGNWAWTQRNVPLTVGQHTVEFRYDKDASFSFGADTVYIDYIEIIGGTPL